MPHNGAAVVFSSHQLELVGGVCDDIAIITRGNVVLEGGLEDIRRNSPIRCWSCVWMPVWSATGIPPGPQRFPGASWSASAEYAAHRRPGTKPADILEALGELAPRRDGVPPGAAESRAHLPPGSRRNDMRPLCWSCGARWSNGLHTRRSDCSRPGFSSSPSPPSWRGQGAKDVRQEQLHLGVAMDAPQELTNSSNAYADFQDIQVDLKPYNTEADAQACSTPATSMPICWRKLADHERRNTPR